jgi:hypothetical protein
MSKKKPAKQSKPRSVPEALSARVDDQEDSAPIESTPVQIAPDPADLPSDPEKFWKVGRPWETILPPANMEAHPALKRLGPLPFPRTGFPLMGFLATLYEHVATHAREAFRSPGQPEAWPTHNDQPPENIETP